MSEKPENPPAFPHVALTPAGHARSREGMTLRDHFAGKTLQSVLAMELGPKGSYQHICPESCRMIAERCFEMADAMLIARAR